MTTAENIQKIVLEVSGKNVADKRIEALRNAGYTVSEVYGKWNFGVVGTCKEEDGGYVVQIKCATSGRGKSKNGYSASYCPCVSVKP